MFHYSAGFARLSRLDNRMFQQRQIDFWIVTKVIPLRSFPPRILISKSKLKATESTPKLEFVDNLWGLGTE
jgi:hypothetical protein